MGGGQQKWIKKFFNVNIINFSEVDNGGGGLDDYSLKLDNLSFLVEPFS